MADQGTRIYPTNPITEDDLRIPAHIEGSLRFHTGTNAGQVLRLEKTTTVVGRGEGADVLVDDDSMSRRHFQISYRKLEFRLRDLDSANGTFLNGSEVEEYALHDGDRILAGETLFHFHVKRV